MVPEENSYAENPLEHLNRSKYEIVPSQPDIIGWWVTDGAGAKIGNVDDLIFSPVTRRVQHLVVNVADNDFGLKSKCVLMPIDMADLRKREALVVVPNVNASILKELPPYQKEQLNAGACDKADLVFKAPKGHPANGVAEKSDDHSSNSEPLETFRNGEMEIKLYKEVPVIKDKTKIMKEKEPFEIYIDGEMLTVIPQDETYTVYKGMSKLGDIMPHQDDSGLVWVTGDLIPLDYLAQIGEQIEQSSAWNQIKSE